MVRAALFAVILGLATAGGARSQEDAADAAAQLTPALRSTDLIFNGITRSKDGRLFSPFRRQEKSRGIELGEWRDGRPVAYSDESWNAWKAGDDASEAFVGVNAIRMGPDGDLWVLDKGAAGFGSKWVGKRLVGEVGLEPTKLTQRIYSPPPLPLGTFPQGLHAVETAATRPLS